jgi:hypothetical protein
MNVSMSLGENLGLTHGTAIEPTRRGNYCTHYVTVWRLHVIVSTRVK